MAGMGVAWSRQESCSSLDGMEIADWNTMMPANTTMQYLPKFFSFFYHQVDVLDTHGSHVGPVGYWTDLNLFFGFVNSFVYTDSRGTDRVVMEARAPWGLYLGLRYDLWRCAGDHEDSYQVTEDYWAKPWFFNWNSEKVFNIVDKRSWDTVAKVHSRTENKNPFFPGSIAKFMHQKHIIVTDLKDDKIAEVIQESQLHAGFRNRRFFSVNARPDIVPNEVVSFLGAVWEINEAKASESDNDHDNFSRRRRSY
eukprot:CAMPEP_0198509738 /NCGR_PEP_ID=MMETSP1462-20131121/13748_1 /TAXON_ID=1333877 /ORGANISM="Brandtodinium nutriculum, Strain RCC3387" /LENGTH=251 /DNA_ID=CAMNT_0044239049 /DNA_START=140 /DNA_END=892 /DNA_ORIENTATION=-